MMQKTEMINFSDNAGDHKVNKYGKKVSCEAMNILLLFGIVCLVIIQQVALNDAKTKINELSSKVTDLQKNDTDQKNCLRELERLSNKQIDVNTGNKTQSEETNTDTSVTGVLDINQMRKFSKDPSSALSRHYAHGIVALEENFDNITKSLDSVTNEPQTREETQKTLNGVVEKQEPFASGPSHQDSREYEDVNGDDSEWENY